VKKENTAASDTLRIKTTRTCPLGKRCPVYLVNAGMTPGRVIRAGDTIRLDKDPNHIHRVVSVTTDYGPHLGRFMIGGKSEQLAAAMLILDNKSVIYVRSNVEKICASCREVVVTFDN